MLEVCPDPFTLLTLSTVTPVVPPNTINAPYVVPGDPEVNALEKRQPPVYPAEPVPHLFETEIGWLKKIRSEPLLNSDIGEHPALALPGGLDWALAPTIGGFAGESGVAAFALLKGEEYKNAALELFAAHPRMVPVGVRVVPETLLK
jgi:hypothetical protein